MAMDKERKREYDRERHAAKEREYRSALRRGVPLGTPQRRGRQLATQIMPPVFPSFRLPCETVPSENFTYYAALMP